MLHSRRLLIWLLGSVCIACSEPGQFDTTQVEREAQVFMEGYAQDLLSHDIAAIVDRYDRSGAYFLGHGKKTFEPFDSVRARYRDAWQGPAAFEWHDLSFEVISGDAVIVAGRFSWTMADTLPPMSMSYTGLLLRQDGGLRIRLEDESLDLSQAQTMMQQLDSGNQ